MSKRLSVQEIYALISETPPVEFTEDELKTNPSDKTQDAIFASPALLKKFEELPEDVKQKYKSYGTEYYTRTIDNIKNSVEKVASEHLRAVRAGLSPSDLTEDEKYIIRSVYGKEWYLIVGLESEN